MTLRSIVLAAALFAFWLAMSGHYTLFLVAAGAASALLVVLFTRRKGSLDAESVPLELVTGSITYFPWLILEIAKSALAVARVILDPRLPISPVMTVLDSRLATAAGLSSFANSITLTPGTVTCGVAGRRLTVYALVREGALDIEAGTMEDRALRFEGGAR